jgi:hypothetical protein
MGKSNLLFESLFRSKIGAKNELEYLQQVTEEYPYFSPGQYYLLERTSPDSPAYPEQVAKTAVLFNNPYWLSFQLQENTEATFTPDADLARNAGDVAEDQPGQLPVWAVADMDEPFLNPLEEGPQLNSKTGTDEIDGHQVAQEAQSGKENEETNLPLVEGSGLEPAQQITDPAESAGQEKEFNNPEETGIRSKEGEELPVKESTYNPEKSDEPIAEMINPTETAVPGESKKELDSEPEEVAYEEDEVKEIEPLNIKLNFNTPPPTDETLSFEPLHTTDYFASQGIRLSGDIRPNDKLGKQLKSFTEWLKTMKKIHTEQLADTVNQTDISIQKLAERSNAEDEVVTEAMADVLVQQGKASKAAEVYKKLSLLNPSKSAYFAAKIDQLKEQ